MNRLSNTPTPDPHASSAAAHRRRIFLQSAAIVGASVFLSRVLGFLREWAIADRIGSNATTDAYYAAFTIPDILNYLLAGGALSITFIPIFLEYFTSRREEEGWRVFSIVLSAMSVLLLILLVVAEVYAPVFTHWIAPGFTEEQHRIVTHLTRIMLPAQAFFYIGGVLSAVQYARGRFLIPSLAPLVYNGMIISFGMLLSNRWGIEAFSWGVVAGSLLGNCLLQVYGVSKCFPKFRFSLNLRHPGFRQFLRLTVPIMLGFSLIFVDDWAMRWYGSFLVPASITWLFYGKTLMRVVVAIFGQAAGVATFPVMARLVAEEKWPEMKESLQDALRHVILTIVPASVLMAILSRQIVFLLFSHTRLQLADIEQTALAMVIFLAGAFAWGGQAILARGFYALQDTLTPTLIGSGLALAWFPLYWLFAERWQHLGLAAASSLGIVIYAAVLGIVLFRRLRLSLFPLGSFLLRTAAASFGAGGIAFLLERRLEEHVNWQSMTGSLAGGTAASLAFVASFLALASLAKLFSWRKLRATIVRATRSAQ